MFRRTKAFFSKKHLGFALAVVCLSSTTCKTPVDRKDDRSGPLQEQEAKDGSANLDAPVQEDGDRSYSLEADSGSRDADANLPLSSSDATDQESADSATEVLQANLNQAEFAFRGKVSKITYAKAKAKNSGSGAAAIPLTYVTFGVEKAYKGAYQEDAITLRFVGGPNSHGGVMTSSQVPLFNVGQRDIIFASGNGKALAPVFAHGRYRLTKNSIVDGYGHRLETNAAGEIVRGALDRDIATEEFVIGKARIKRVLSPVVEKTGDKALGADALPNSTAQLALAGATALKLAAFEEKLTALVEASPTKTKAKNQIKNTKPTDDVVIDIDAAPASNR